MNRKVVAGIRDARYSSIDDVERALAEVGEVTRGDVQRAMEALLEPPVVPLESFKLACSFFVGIVRMCADRSLFAPMVRALPKVAHQAQQVAREALIKAIPMVNNLPEHRELSTLLRSNDESVRAATLRILEKVVVNQTIEVIASDFKSGGPWAAPARVLTDLVDKLGPRVLPIFTAGIASSDPRIVQAALEATAAIGDAHGVQGLDRDAFLEAARARLRDSDDDMAGAAMGCFARMCGSEDAFVEAALPVLELGGPRAVAAVLRGVARHPSSRTLALLEARLIRGPSRVSIVALQVLQEIATDDVLTPLVAAIAHHKQRVRTEAVKVFKALAQSAKIDVARGVLWLLRSRDANVRRMASEVLQALSGRGAAVWPRLVGFIRDEDWWVRERLADALVPMAGSALIPHIVPFLDDASAGMRRFAVHTLGRVGDGQALGALLLRARDDDDWLVREQAVRAIGAIGDERGVPYLVKLLDHPGLEVACLDSLAQLRRDDARERLGELLQRPERDVRMAALRYARVTEASEHIDSVAVLLYDPDDEIAKTAGATLRAWHYGGASDPALDEAGRVLADLLRRVVKGDGSDLILVSGQPAFMKVQGRTEKLTQRALTAENVYELLAPLLSAEHVAALANRVDIDFSHDNRRLNARFRVNAFQGEGGLGAVFRTIKNDVAPLESLGVPAVVNELCLLENGIVLFGGPPGSGKSTTLAGIIDRINKTQSRHIISIEDPIEAVHSSVQSLLTQREIGVHTADYHSALRAALRQDPDVILVGELRDLETIAFAVTAAETGHLVFGTVHAVAADQCVERVINAFPSERQAQIRTMLADTLRVIVCQHLMPKKGGGRALACEVMKNSESIANLIRKGQAHQIASQMQLGREAGNQLMDDSLAALVQQGVVSVSDAYMKARDKTRFPMALEPILAVPEVPLAKPGPSARDSDRAFSARDLAIATLPSSNPSNPAKPVDTSSGSGAPVVMGTALPSGSAAAVALAAANASSSTSSPSSSSPSSSSPSSSSASSSSASSSSARASPTSGTSPSTPSTIAVGLGLPGASATKSSVPPVVAVARAAASAGAASSNIAAHASVPGSPSGASSSAKPSHVTLDDPSNPNPPRPRAVSMVDDDGEPRGPGRSSTSSGVNAKSSGAPRSASVGGKGASPAGAGESSTSFARRPAPKSAPDNAMPKPASTGAASASHASSTSGASGASNMPSSSSTSAAAPKVVTVPEHEAVKSEREPRTRRTMVASTTAPNPESAPELANELGAAAAGRKLNVDAAAGDDAASLSSTWRKVDFEEDEAARTSGEHEVFAGNTSAVVKAQDVDDGPTAQLPKLPPKDIDPDDAWERKETRADEHAPDDISDEDLFDNPPTKTEVKEPKTTPSGVRPAMRPPLPPSRKKPNTPGRS